MIKLPILASEDREMIEAMDGSTLQKCQQLADFTRQLDTEKAAIKRHLREVEAELRRIERFEENAAEWMLEQMLEQGISKIESKDKYITLSVHHNPQKVVITDKAQIPPDMLRMKVETKFTPDKEKIKRVLNTGGPVMGAHIEQGCRLKVTFNDDRRKQ